MLREFCNFLKDQKKWWIVPAIILFLLLGALLIFARSSSLTPFLYHNQL